MSPESIQGLSIPREVVLSVLRGEERLAEVRRLRVIAALAQAEADKDAA
jgi:hypothetical protein